MQKRTYGSLSFLLFLLAATMITGCETLKGAGQDIQNAGEELDEAIDD